MILQGYVVLTMGKANNGWQSSVFFFNVRGLREGKNKNENIYKTAGAAWLSGKCFTYTNTEPDNMVTS